MQYQIDQSIKIEETRRNTILGLSNDKDFVVVIEAKIKRRLQESFRKLGRPRLFVYRTFIGGIVLLLKYANLKNLKEVTIDKEYHGQEKILKSMFLEMWSRYFEDIPVIQFRKIGRQSKAHNVSYLAMKKRRKADKILSYVELRQLVLK